MPSTNARRSKRHEREIVHAAEDAGLDAERAWNSDGRSLGEHREADCRRKERRRRAGLPPGGEVGAK